MSCNHYENLKGETETRAQLVEILEKYIPLPPTLKLDIENMGPGKYAHFHFESRYSNLFLTLIKDRTYEYRFTQISFTPKNYTPGLLWLVGSLTLVLLLNYADTRQELKTLTFPVFCTGLHLLFEEYMKDEEAYERLIDKYVKLNNVGIIYKEFHYHV